MGPLSYSVTLHQNGKSCQGQTISLAYRVQCNLRRKWSIENTVIASLFFDYFCLMIYYICLSHPRIYLVLPLLTQNVIRLIKKAFTAPNDGNTK